MVRKKRFPSLPLQKKEVPFPHRLGGGWAHAGVGQGVWYGGISIRHTPNNLTPTLPPSEAPSIVQSPIHIEKAKKDAILGQKCTYNYAYHIYVYYVA